MVILPPGMETLDVANIYHHPTFEELQKFVNNYNIIPTRQSYTALRTRRKKHQQQKDDNQEGM